MMKLAAVARFTKSRSVEAASAAYPWLLAFASRGDVRDHCPCHSLIVSQRRRHPADEFPHLLGQFPVALGDQGDEIEIVASGARRFEVRRDRSRERALERLRSLKKPLPKGFRFDRDEVNAR
jgi:hypothetical protein